MRAAIYGTNGGLATALCDAFIEHEWEVTHVGRYDSGPYRRVDVYVFPQGSFLRKPFVDITPREESELLDAGLHSILNRLHECLSLPVEDRPIDYVIIGSTSSYEGFAGSSIYCMIKHGLLGLVRSLNVEYKNTNRRFWLFSPGTMDTKMGRRLTDQDSSTFLSPRDVAERIVTTVVDASNMFEPEVIIRRRTVR